MASARELPSQADLELIEHARRIIDENTDGVVHTVAAAVRDTEGRVFCGVNLHHFNGGPCAELVALATARTGGAREIETIVAVGDEGRGVMAPCGRDRQVFADYYPEIRVLVPTSDGVQVATVDQLLPWQPSR